MNLKNVYISVLMFFCVSCVKETAKDVYVNPSCHLYPINETQTINNIDNYIDSIEIFQIELNNEALFSNVKKAIIGKNGEFYILDIDNNLICFDKEGKHCRRVAKRGLAHNEYINIEDIALSADGKYLLLLESSNRVIKYPIIHSESNIERIVLDIIYPLDAIAPSKDNGMYCFASYPSTINEYKDSYYQLYNTDNTGKVLERYLPCNDFSMTIMNITQSRNNTYLLRPQNSSHIVYRLSKDSINAAYKIDFEDENIPHRYYYDGVSKNIMEYINSPYFKVPLYFYETDDILYFSANGRNRQYSYVYSLEKKEGINWIENDVDIETLQIIGSDNMFIYAIVYPMIKDDDYLEKHGALYTYVQKYITEHYQSMTSNDNPFIVKIRFEI